MTELVVLIGEGLRPDRFYRMRAPLFAVHDVLLRRAHSRLSLPTSSHTPTPRVRRRDLLDYCHRDALAMVSEVETSEGLARVAP